VLADREVPARRSIKYNHLLANCLIFHSVCMVTRALHKLRAEGVAIGADAVAALSHIRSHVSRFGQYNLGRCRWRADTWNTVYLERAVETLRASGTVVPDELHPSLSPLAS
jgi:hypothetical protein